MSNGDSQSGQEGAQDPQASPEGQGNGSPQSPNPSQGQGPGAGQGAQAGGRATEGPEGAQSGFDHPDLQGKSPQEIERMYSMQKQINSELSQEVGQQGQSGQQPGQSPQMGQGTPGQQGQQGQGTSEPSISDDEFWDRPAEATQSLVRNELKQAIGPLQQQLNQLANSSQVEQAEQRYRQRWPDYDEMKPYIVGLMDRKGLDRSMLADEGVVETLYLALKGAQSTGMLDTSGQQGAPQGQGPANPSPQQGPGQTPQGQAPQGNRQGQPGQQGQAPRGQQGARQGQRQSPQQQGQGQQMPNQPPQHRPSNSPPPSQGQSRGEGQTRELTESEKDFAEHYNMSPEEYIAWQEQEADQVVTGPRPGQEE